MRVHVIATTIVMALALCGTASAGIVTGSVGSMPTYSPMDLSDGTSDWVIYGGLGSNGSGTDMTTGTASSSFTPVSITGAGPYTKGLSGVIKYAYDAAYGTYPSGAVTSIDNAPVVADSGTLSEVSFTHTLLGAAETLNIVVCTKSTNMQWVDLSASLNTGGSWSVINQQLPTTAGNKGYFGIVSLDVTGAVGDQLSFTVSSNYTNVASPPSYYGVGLSSATATVVPEPATMALFAMGGLALIRRKR